MANPYEQLAQAEAVEQLAAEIYERLAGHFATTPDAAAVFRQLAEEEQQHAVRIQMLRKQLAQHPKSMGELRLDLTLMAQLLHEGRVLLELLGRPGCSLTLAEAKAAMIELERNFASAHAHAMVDPEAGALHGFFQQLAQQDQQHAQLLAEIPELC